MARPPGAPQHHILHATFNQDATCARRCVRGACVRAAVCANGVVVDAARRALTHARVCVRPLRRAAAAWRWPRAPASASSTRRRARCPRRGARFHRRLRRATKRHTPRPTLSVLPTRTHAHAPPPPRHPPHTRATPRRRGSAATRSAPAPSGAPHPRAQHTTTALLCFRARDPRTGLSCGACGALADAHPRAHTMACAHHQPC
jgi:hypothetical protein